MSQVHNKRRTLLTAFAFCAVLAGLVILMPQGAWISPVTTHAASGTSAEARETFVFQVGIDKYISPNVPTLDGCVQDVNDMKALLIKKFNVPVTHFLTLRNGQATHAAIIAGFRTQLIENAKLHRDATVIFQFSGHGSRVKDRSGTKADGLSSTLVPVDSRDLKGSYFDIVDDEIRQLFEELSQFTTNITFIIDACHSGNPTRGAGKTRGIPDDPRPQPPPTTKPASTKEPLLRGGDLTAMLPRGQRYVSLASSLSYELANEKTEGAKANGALTFYLLKHLGRATPETTYRELMAQVANAVTTDFPNQHPQVEGDIRRLVFGGSANREDPFIEIQDIKDDAITIKAGAAQGIAAGTVVAVYAPDALRLAGSDKKLTNGTVTLVTAFTSSVKLDQPKGVTTQAKVVVVSPDFGSVQTQVAFAKVPATRGSSAGAETKAKLTELLQNNSALKLAGEVNLEVASARGINWDVVVKQVKFSDWFRQPTETPPPLSAPTPRLPDRLVYCLAGPDGARPLFDFFVELNDPEGAQKLADALGKLANQRVLRAINNETSQLNGGIKITVLRVYGKIDARGFTKTREEVIDLLNDAVDYPFDQGEFFRFDIENQSNQDLYITVFDISSDGSIKVVYPDVGRVEILPKGGKSKTQSLIFKTTEPAGYETFKVIASTDQRGPSDFTFLEQAGIRTARRSLPVSVANFPDWTTSQVNLLISDKVK